MRICTLFAACLLVVAVAASAATVSVTTGNMNGWVATATSVWGGTTNASVTQTTDQGAGNFKFQVGTQAQNGPYQWAGISTSAFNGTLLSTITSLKIREYGLSGGNLVWEPPMLTFTVIKGNGDNNQRNISWRPWGTRSVGQWNEYDAATQGTWFVYETGASYSSFQALKNALPTAQFEVAANLTSDYGYVSHNAFNVGYCPLYNEDVPWMHEATGYVDWFEVGVSGSVTRYDLGVPEPSSVLALLAGVLGLAGTIRRRK